MAPSGADSAGVAGEEIKPYQMRVSSRYLDLTRQKLELTRLPHESPGPKSSDWWEPKPTVEPLIDFWLEQYSWRDQEEKLNASVPQFRTSIAVPGSEIPARIHFVHARSTHANAVPLLLIPQFPFTNLSLGHLIGLFTDPDDASVEQPFHLVIPSLPGLGFSDALPSDASVIPTTAALFDILMRRLDYDHYIASNSGPASSSPSGIDWRLANYLSRNHQSSCLGVHLISPLLSAPKLRESPVAWTKWKLASTLRVAILGYSNEDFAALQRATDADRDEDQSFSPQQFGLGTTGLGEPNTLSYALCDSPVGLLLFILMLLRVLGTTKEFSNSELITMTELTWLPGPEAMMRFWAYAASHKDLAQAQPLQKPKVGITVFLGEDETTSERQGDSLDGLPRAFSNVYSCPTWAKTQYQVVSSNRVAGKPGLLAWERPEVITSGVRSLAKAILVDDKRMQKAELPGIALLEQVVVDGGSPALADISGSTVQVAPGSSPKLPVGTPSPKAFSPGEAAPDRPVPVQDSTGHLRPVPPKTMQSPEASPMPAAVEQAQDTYFEETESPDTVVAISPPRR